MTMKTKMKLSTRTSGALAAVLVLCAALAWLYVGRPAGGGRADKETANSAQASSKAQKTGTERVREVLARKIKAAKPSAEKKKKYGAFEMGAGMFGKMKPADRKIALSVQNALDSEDLSGVVSFMEDVQASQDPALREHMVEALSWFGPDALPELTSLLSDSDPDVADAAANAWESALSEVDDEALKLQVAVAATTALTNTYALTMLMSEVSGTSDDLKIVQAFVDVILDGTKEAAEAAKVGYEELTGEKFTDVDAAEKWLQDNYEPNATDDDDADDAGGKKKERE